MDSTEGRFLERSDVADNSSHLATPGQVVKSQPLPDMTMIDDMTPNDFNKSHRTVEEEVQIDGVSETRLRWKIDLLILPLLSSVFFLSTLGSSNIGNAETAGLNEDLNITPTMFTNITSVLLVGTVIAQLPATLLLRKFGPQRQFAGAMLIWGLFTLGSAFAKNYATIMACRFFIGLAEALVQGGLLYLAFWYEYTELATRAAVLSAITALAGAFGGLVAYAIIQNHDGQNGWMAWRWIFLIEGILPAGWSFVVLLLLPPSPQKIRGGFTEREKELLIQRSIRSHNTGNNKIKPKLIHKVLVDPQWWLFAGIQSLLYMCSNTTAIFLPSIMTGLGYSGVKAQLMSVIPYAAYFVVILVVSYLSDLTKLRGPWILACSIVTAVGYIVLLTTNDLVGRLIATCLVLAGANTGAVISFSWLVSSNVGYTFRGSAVGMVNIVVYLVSVGGQHGFTDPPLYHKGLKICLIMDCIAILFIVLQTLLFRTLNARKRQQQNSPEAEALRGLSLDDIGNKSPDYFFSY